VRELSPVRSKMARSAPLALLLLLGPVSIALRQPPRSAASQAPPIKESMESQMPALSRPPPPQEVQPSHIYTLGSDKARALNAAISFSERPNPAASPFRFTGGSGDLARAIDCLASAQIYEAGDDAVGEQAVAQVVLNRVRHPAFPKSVCGVVFQGQERRTGCQFTFTCDGALARTLSPVAWARARAIAKAALGGAVFPRVGLATHYHTDWVVPYWSARLDKTARVGTHLFFRWAGRGGAPSAFQPTTTAAEPVIGQIARLSFAHRNGTVARVLATATSSARWEPEPLALAQTMPPANKRWEPTPAIPLPVGARRTLEQDDISLIRIPSCGDNCDIRRD